MAIDGKRSLAGLSVLALVAFVVGSALLSGGAVWCLQQRATVRAEQRAVEAEERLAGAESERDRLEAELASVTAVLEGARRPAGDAGAGEPDGTEERQDASDAVEDGKRIGFVTRLHRGDALALDVDWAELLTGEDAVAAYAADGLGELDGELYYIRNRDRSTQRVTVAPGAEVVVHSWFADTREIGPVPIRLSEFSDAMPGGRSPKEGVGSMPYWLTVEGGLVVRIEEQFIP